VIALAVADEVAAALAGGGAVVALESTLVAHGLPWPDNLEVARALEAEVRAAGAVPATIAVMGGRACIGVDRPGLERLARDGAGFVKAGAADLAVHIARGGDAATTVSSTAWLAARAGIRVFATGGIGGVHRPDHADVSADLDALARTPIAVVSAGAKAILDLHRTAEALESLGVLVIGFGCDELPAFWSRASGIRLDHRIDEVAELARVVAARFALDQGGVLVANPIPAADEIPAAAIAGLLAGAEQAAAAAGVAGKQLTPFLLAEMARRSGGTTVRANRALALGNARLAAALAIALQALV